MLKHEWTKVLKVKKYIFLATNDALFERLIVLIWQRFSAQNFVINLRKKSFFLSIHFVHITKLRKRISLMCIYGISMLRVDAKMLKLFHCKIESCALKKVFLLLKTKRNFFFLSKHNVKIFHETLKAANCANWIKCREKEKKQTETATQLWTIKSQRAKHEKMIQVATENNALMITAHYTRRRCSNEL